MKIELYTFTYNDEDFLPFFLQYYSLIVDRMTFIDSGSTDRTLELIKDHEVVQTGLTWWDWDNLHSIRDSIWRDSEFDLIFFPDLDEIFYKENLRQWLDGHRSAIYKMKGYQMVSREFPELETNILDIKRGCPLPLHDKYTIFNPKADLKFVDAHNIATTSRNINMLEIKLLHYKYLGADNMVRRANLIIDRVPRGSFSKNIDGNILVKFPAFIKTKREYQIEIEEMLEKSIAVI